MFRDEILRCPACEGGFEKLGDRQVCGGCGSIFIGAPQLEALLDEIAPDDKRPLGLRIFRGTQRAYTCPACTVPMAPGRIHDCELAQCDQHGVWLEQPAFERLLHNHGLEYIRRTDENTPITYLMAVPLLGVMAVPLQLVAVPLTKRLRMRKYLRQTTPPKKT